MNRKRVYLFNELSDAKNYVSGLLGEKGANLADITKLEIPVPNVFTVTTKACNSYLAAEGHFFEGVWEQDMEAFHVLEANTGKSFGKADNPLLVSCRSGAKFSMPRMMDTVLYIGLKSQTVFGIANLSGDEKFAYDSYRRLIQMFGSVVMGISDDAFEEALNETKKSEGVEVDYELTALALKTLAENYKIIFKRKAWREFPQYPLSIKMESGK